ncbi:MAG: hypothetical protein AAGG80_00040 [Pseudomonadota bacterium]
MPSRNNTEITLPAFLQAYFIYYFDELYHPEQASCLNKLEAHLKQKLAMQELDIKKLPDLINMLSPKASRDLNSALFAAIGNYQIKCAQQEENIKTIFTSIYSAEAKLAETQPALTRQQLFLLLKALYNHQAVQTTPSLIEKLRSLIKVVLQQESLDFQEIQKMINAILAANYSNLSFAETNHIKSELLKFLRFVAEHIQLANVQQEHAQIDLSESLISFLKQLQFLSNEDISVNAKLQFTQIAQKIKDQYKDTKTLTDAPKIHAAYTEILQAVMYDQVQTANDVEDTFKDILPIIKNYVDTITKLYENYRNHTKRFIITDKYYSEIPNASYRKGKRLNQVASILEDLKQVKSFPQLLIFLEKLAKKIQAFASGQSQLKQNLQCIYENLKQFAWQYHSHITANDLSDDLGLIDFDESKRNLEIEGETFEKMLPDLETSQLSPDNLIDPQEKSKPMHAIYRQLNEEGQTPIYRWQITKKDKFDFLAFSSVAFSQVASAESATHQKPQDILRQQANQTYYQQSLQVRFKLDLLQSLKEQIHRYKARRFGLSAKRIKYALWDSFGNAFNQENYTKRIRQIQIEQLLEVFTELESITKKSHGQIEEMTGFVNLISRLKTIYEAIKDKKSELKQVVLHIQNELIEKYLLVPHAPYVLARDYPTEIALKSNIISTDLARKFSSQSKNLEENNIFTFRTNRRFKKEDERIKSAETNDVENKKLSAEEVAAMTPEALQVYIYQKKLQHIQQDSQLQATYNYLCGELRGLALTAFILDSSTGAEKFVLKPGENVTRVNKLTKNLQSLAEIIPLSGISFVANKLTRVVKDVAAEKDKQEHQMLMNNTTALFKNLNQLENLVDKIALIITLSFAEQIKKMSQQDAQNSLKQFQKALWQNLSSVIRKGEISADTDLGRAVANLPNAHKDYLFFSKTIHLKSEAANANNNKVAIAAMTNQPAEVYFENQDGNIVTYFNQPIEQVKQNYAKFGLRQVFSKPTDKFIYERETDNLSTKVNDLKNLLPELTSYMYEEKNKTLQEIITIKEGLTRNLPLVACG